MPKQLTIQAEVIDIRNDGPQTTDSFLVDTNIWLWQTYSKSMTSGHRDQQKISTYTSYLKRARIKGSDLFYSGLLFAELSHVIEVTERRIYERRIGSTIKPKDYRHDYPAEHANVVSEVESAWKQVQQFATSITLVVDEITTNSALQRFRSQALDGYDLFLVEAISRAKVNPVRILTDDMDYATVPSIQVFTGNSFVIQQAQQQKKLVVR